MCQNGKEISMRLDKFLVDCGVGSRTEVKKFLKNKQVTVNGQVETSPKQQINEQVDLVAVAGDILHHEQFVYYLLNKPKGVISATEDDHHRTVLDLLDEIAQHKEVFPVGRLDIDTHGLLLLTNNGKLAHAMLSPKKHVDKIYEVHLRESISDENIKKLESGVIILDNYFTKEAKVNKVEDKIIELTITEGKYHQVKEMLKAVGNEVVYLKRLSFGKLELGNLKKGEVIEISLEDIE